MQWQGKSHQEECAMNLTKLDLASCRTFAVETAEAAGRIVRNGFGGTIHRSAKGAAGDVVTSLDGAADRLIVDRLHRAFPSHRILSEESGTAWDSPGPWTWLVDPLDGSNNIVVGLPVAAIGLTLCHNSKPKVGVVHEPFVSRTCSAAYGAGAWQGGDEPLRRRSNPGRYPVVAWTQGYGISTRDCTARALRLALREYARRVLELWAPLCAWMMLARGDIDGIVGYNIGELDLHAGALIADMTGVEIRTFNGTPFDTRFYGLQENRSLVAAAPERIDELLALVARPALYPIS
jgi:myo-inositol-1(or 4)-monophosphatase